MSNLRKEIEHQFKVHGLLNDENKTENNVSEENQVSDEVLTEGIEGEPTAEITTIIIAPKGYQEKFADDFKNLPSEWQVFLSEREADIDAQLHENAIKLQAYKVLDDLFELNRARLAQHGIEKMQDWLSGLAFIDQQMESNPLGMLLSLAETYGVSPQFFLPEKHGLNREFISRLCCLENKYHDLTSYLQNQKTQKFIEMLQMFGRQTDLDGNLTHPFFEEVKNLVFALLDKGVSPDIENAYENALWLTPSIRAQLIKKIISAQTSEAEKAKKAAFAPKGKTEAPERPLTLREEIAKNMAAFMD